MDFDEPAPAIAAAPVAAPEAPHADNAFSVPSGSDMFSGLNTKAVSEPMGAPMVAPNVPSIGAAEVSVVIVLYFTFL